MYSLAGKVIEVENEETIIVQFRDDSKVKARKDKDANVKSGDFVSVMGSSDKNYKFEMCGKNKVTADFIWGK